VIKPGDKVFDCACGTGAYVFPLYELGADIWAYDLTPKHIKILNSKLKEKGIFCINTGICNAEKLSQFSDEFFDTVICMGPLYHLMSVQEQKNCICECKRVVKKGGVVIFSYLNRFAILPYVLKKDMKHFNSKTIEMFLANKCTYWKKDDFCFFTDSYYHIPEEIDEIMKSLDINKLWHIGSDGLSYDYEEFVNSLNDNDLNTWLFYHFYICEQKSLLGVSQHGLYIGRT